MEPIRIWPNSALQLCQLPKVRCIYYVLDIYLTVTIYIGILQVLLG